MAPSTRRISAQSSPRTLTDLLSAGSHVAPGLSGVQVAGVTTDSRLVEQGYLFVAVVGSSDDGHDHLEEAVQRGAVALLVERPVEGASGVPVVQVENARRELARISARWYGEPAERLPLVGITGTLGKTTVMSMFESILLRSDRRLGTIGSLGVRIGGEAEQTGYTAPDPMILHAALEEIAEAGAELAAMEVTTHALSQERVHGLHYDLGIFTNLVPLEHVDYHGSFRGYVEAKTRYFDHLRSGVPLVYSHDDRAVRGVVRGRDLQPIGVGREKAADVRFSIQRMDAEGSGFTLISQRPLPMMGGGELEPFALDLRLRTLGRSMIGNAALAATGALLCGASPGAVAAALADFPAPRRRMELLRTEPFQVLDDTAGHPDSMGVVFDVVKHLAPNRVHVCVAIRGKRGARINRRVAEALAIWVEQVPLATMVVTTSRDQADDLNTVTTRERNAFVGALEKAGVPFMEHERLDRAVRHVVDRASRGDLVLLIGAQGMDEGARLLDEAIGTPAPSRGSD
jgi:UDP-N-acetylmuramoyl-L-alanyl-D-glutamate--2,6-diaminopimelate ligase